MAREFPILWDTKFKFTGSLRVEDYCSGRMDLVAADANGNPETYFLLAAANGIRNVMPLRTTIRPVDEAVRNELSLRGMSGVELERAIHGVLENLEVGAGDWLSYESSGSLGAITDVESGKVCLVPDMTTSLEFTEKYAGDKPNG